MGAPGLEKATNLLLLLGRFVRAFRDDRRVRGCRFVFVKLFASVVVECGKHTDIDGKPLSRMTFIDSADRSHVTVIPSVCHANVLQSQWLPQGWIKPSPSGTRQVNLSPRVRGIAADYFLQLRVWGSGAFRNQVAGDVTRGQASPADYAEQQVSEVLANSRAERERIFDRGIDVRRAFHVLKSQMDQVGCRLHEAGDGSVAALISRRN